MVPAGDQSCFHHDDLGRSVNAGHIGQLIFKLLLDREIKALNYNVETVNGVIYMIGIAQDEIELDRVTNHARTIKNVVKVVSHVRVKGAS